MARIRTIKPEFPQSESMGRVSRDARLLFIMLWTIADDAGRTRAASRMLASLLFPYDDDAARLIPGWLTELERENCVRVYTIDDNTYLQIEKWDQHQKIDRPSPSRLPQEPSRPKHRERSRKPREDSPQSREPSSTDLVPSTKDLGRDHGPKKVVPANADTFAHAMALYNSVAKQSGWPEAQQLTTKRQTAFKARLVECGGLDGWMHAMERAGRSDFLTGRTPRGEGHEKWMPDLDFFLQQQSFTKLMEGSYDNHKSAERGGNVLGAIQVAANLIGATGNGFGNSDGVGEARPGVPEQFVEGRKRIAAG